MKEENDNAGKNAEEKAASGKKNNENALITKESIGAVGALFSALAFLNGGELGLSLFAFIFAFSLVAFLFFNVYPAKVFMGDCGSLATGAAISCIVCFSGNALYSALSGVCFVISGLSVIIQVLHYKRTKKRIFKMAPFHHHLQHSSVSEPRIAMLYFIISLLASLVCFL